MSGLAAGRHYDEVHDLWKKVMGDEFHFCYLDAENNLDDLQAGTKALTQRMFDAIPVHFGSQSVIVDVGCGTGIHTNSLATQFGCKVVGVSPSEVAINQARLKYSNANLEFISSGILDSGLHSESVDLFWALESSHLIRPKADFFNFVSSRLKPGGAVVLCDFFVGDSYLSLDRKALKSVWRAFGPVDVLKVKDYKSLISSAGLQLLNDFDISKEVAATPRIWSERAKQSSVETMELVEDLVAGCESLTDAFERNILNYHILTAVKA